MCKPVWTFILCFFLLFVILFLRIYAPDILLVFSAAQDVVHGLEGGGHGVIHVIVAVLTVTTYAVEVLEGVQILDQVIHMIVGIEVCRICLLYTLSVGIQHVLLAGDDAHLYQLGDTELHPLLFTHVPILIALTAEILQTNPCFSE